MGARDAAIAVDDNGLTASLDRVLGLKPAVVLQLALLFAYLGFQTGGVPALNESVYLLYLARQWDPSVLANDWTFSGPLGSHTAFNLLFGPLTSLFSLEVVGWIGRILSWSFILFGLFRVATHFRAPPWMTTTAILLWLFYGQSVVAGEWILGAFEAKGIAYGLLFLALSELMYRRRVVLPAALLGSAFSFHPVVGLWAGLAVGFSLLVLRYPVATLTRFAGFTTLFALPGLLPLLTTPVDNSAEAWRFVTLVAMPYHFDPFSFKPWMVFALPVLLGFNAWHFRSTHPTPAMRFLMWFQVFLALFFVLGFLARLTESYAVLRLMPCRLFPVLVPLFFFFHLTSALRQVRSLRSPQAVVAGGFLALTALGIPAKLTADHLKAIARDRWAQSQVEEQPARAPSEEDLTEAFRWVAGNTPVDAVIILPPWRKDSFYLARRAQIANWWVLRFDRLSEWRERLEELAGDLSGLTDGTEKATMSQTVHHYDNLTETDIASLVGGYQAQYLVSSASYGYPILFQAGSYTVYSLMTQVRPE